MNASIFFFDLDNTLADARDRFRAAGPEPLRLGNEQQYNTWLESVQDDNSLLADKPLSDMLAKVKALRDSGTRIAVLTAREEKFRGVSEFWLHRHGLGGVPVLMRPNGNTQTAHTFKRDVLMAQQDKAPFSPVIMVDDDVSGELSLVCGRIGVRFFKVYFNSAGRVKCGLLEEVG